jgi:hypothetical protein
MQRSFVTHSAHDMHSYCCNVQEDELQTISPFTMKEKTHAVARTACRSRTLREKDVR